jgi:glycerol uptake facilitator-like aquaporin
MYGIGKRSLAEFFGTFWLVFAGCGSAVLAAPVGGAILGAVVYRLLSKEESRTALPAAPVVADGVEEVRFTVKT